MVSRETDGGAESGVMKPAQGRARRRDGVVPQIADLEILRTIGTGAYGEVWLGRTVTGAYRAVKVVWREDFEDDRSFIREFEGVLQYEPIARHNPGLVHILHVGKHGGEAPYYYYVMELADDAYTGIHIEPGEYRPRTLRSDMQLYGMHAMPTDYVLEVGSQLAHALAGLHAEELTHRDVKPSNVVFVHSRAKLADAGLVAHNSKRSFVGTEGYIPPDGPGTARADVYALAKVLYEMCTGKDRLEFPELPAEMPEGAPARRWQALNHIICAAASPVVDKNSIVTAQELADRLDALRGCAAVPRNRGKAVARPGWWGVKNFIIVMLCLITLAAVGTHFFPKSGQGAAPATPSPPVAAPPADPQTQEKTGRLLITSVPSGAAVYSAKMEYLGETPYGPVERPVGERTTYTLRMAGYADLKLSGQVTGGELLKLGGPLSPYRPPQAGQVWQDALGATYSPAGENHVADTAVTCAHFDEFLRSDAAPEQISYEKTEDGRFVRTTPAVISAYTLWLADRCTANGTIGRDHCLTSQIEPGTAANGMFCYRMRTMPVMKTPITIYSNPAGATVMFNGRVLGVTPMQAERVPIAPYILEVRLAGHSTVRHSGLSPQGLSLNLTLRANNSVVFGAEWINSMGQKFVPLTPNLLVAATEVRVVDYMTFSRATGLQQAPDPGFTRNEHHPVVNVSRADAEAFARWLTQYERKRGLIESGDFYRLPTDAEWSTMAGLPARKDASPYEKDRSYGSFAEQKFAWGHRWPPLRDSGNFADASAQAYVPGDLYIELYRDGFPYTSPVGSFPANALGLHDLSGNVQEWVSDSYGGPEELGMRQHGVTRGGDFTSFSPAQLHLGRRMPLPPNERIPTVGFRLVLERK